MRDKKGRGKAILFKKSLADKLMKKYPAIGKIITKDDVLALVKKEVEKQKILKEQEKTKIEEPKESENKGKPE